MRLLTIFLLIFFLILVNGMRSRFGKSSKLEINEPKQISLGSSDSGDKAVRNFLEKGKESITGALKKLFIAPEKEPDFAKKVLQRNISEIVIHGG
uniref:Uncharacterized protein n=1 Tax=Meloidogyne hapla TaxID=6305 RepID=A0A1I8BNR4_MELHA